MKRVEFWLSTWLMMCTVVPAAHAQGAAAPSSAYKQQIRAAVKAYNNERWREALGLFQEAHQLQPNARTLRGMGLTCERLGRFPEAWQYLYAALADARRPLGGELRTEAKKRLSKAASRVGLVQVELEPNDVQLEVDGASRELGPDGMLALPPGLHTLEARNSDGGFVGTQVELREGERHQLLLVVKSRRLESRLQELEPSRVAATAADKRRNNAVDLSESSGASMLKTVGWIELAAGGALVAAGFGIHASARSLQQDPASAQRRTDLANALFGAGGAIAVGGAAALVIGIVSSGDSQPEVARVGGAAPGIGVRLQY